jgi:hypothetical protein
MHYLASGECRTSVTQITVAGGCERKQQTALDFSNTYAKHKSPDGS